jgi:Domain of unknown function (DUF4190)
VDVPHGTPRLSALRHERGHRPDVRFDVHTKGALVSTQPPEGQPSGYAPPPSYPPPPAGYVPAPPPWTPPSHPAAPAWQQPVPGKATASLVLSLVGLIIFPIVCSILGVILGYQVRSQIDRNPGIRGRGRATWGIVLGWVGLGLWILIVLIALSSSPS